jgi:hypothetical protein
MASPARAAPPPNIPAIIAQVIAAVNQQRGLTAPPPATMPFHLRATTEILGQEPGGRRPLALGGAGNAVFTAWAQAAALVERFTMLRGNGQIAQVNTAVPIAPTIAITNGFGQPIQGVVVTFAVPAGSAGSVTGGTPSTGLNGEASPTAWKLGAAAGLNRLQVSVGGVPMADFVAVAV